MESLFASISNELAVALAGDHSSTWEEIQLLLNFCPKLPTQNRQQTEGDADGVRSSFAALEVSNPAQSKPSSQEVETVVMTARSCQGIVAVARFAALTNSTEFRGALVPILLNYLEALPIYKWEKSLTWRGCSPQEICTYEVTLRLLQIASAEKQMEDQITKVLWKQLRDFEKLLVDAENYEQVCVYAVPCFDSFVRALQDSNYKWSLEGFDTFLTAVRPLLKSDVSARVRTAVASAHGAERESHARKFLARRWGTSGFPGNHLLWRLLSLVHSYLHNALKHDYHELADSKSIFPSKKAKSVNLTLGSCNSIILSESETDIAWDDMTRTSSLTKPPALSEEVIKTLRGTYVLALQYFSDISEYVQERGAAGKSCLPEVHAASIMASGLKIACLSAVHLHEVDESLISKICSALFDEDISLSELQVYMSALDVLSLLAVQFRDLRQTAIDFIKRFLTEPSHAFQNEKLSSQDLLALRDCACRNLAWCLRTHDEELAMSTIYSFLNSLYAISPSDDPIPADGEVAIHMAEENILAVISGLACVMQTRKIFEFAWSILQRRIGHTKSLDPFIIRKLAEMAPVVPADIFQEIIKLFSQLSKESRPEDTNAVASTILECQMGIAKAIMGKPEHFDLYLMNLLSLFVEKGVIMQRMASGKQKSKHSPSTEELGALLPILKELLSREEFKPHVNPTSEAVSLFRNMWFHCVLYGFIRESNWLREWQDSIAVIAAKTPVLVLESATNYLESDLQYNSVLRRGFSEQDLSTLRASLSSLLPTHVHEIRVLSFAQTTFLLSVYHVETMRARENTCSLMLRYFANQGVSSSALASCMETIADHVCNVYIQERRAMGCGVLDQKMDEQVRDLVISCAHRLSEIQALASRYVDKIVEAFPLLFCDSGLLHTLLEVVQLVWQSCESEFHDEYNPTYTFKSPRVKVSIHLPDSYAYRRQLLNKLCESAKKWILISYSAAPLEVAGLLQGYLAELDHLTRERTQIHMGRSVAIEIGRKFYRPEDNYEDVPQAAASVLDNSSEFLLNFALQSHYHGETAGIQRVVTSKSSEDLRVLLAQHDTSDDGDTPLKYLRQRLSLLKRQAIDKKHIPMNRLVSALQAAAAMIIALPGPDAELVNYVCWIPFHVFTAPAMRFATSLWTWIIVERPGLETRVMCNLAAGWEWTIREKKGLFSHALNYRDPFSYKISYTPSDRNIRVEHTKQVSLSLAPHSTLIQFMTGRFEVVRHKSPHLLYLFLQLLEFTFVQRKLMSTHPMSSESRFMLLLLGFKVLRCKFVDNMSEYRFRMRLYETAFAWFELLPSWSGGAGKQGTLTEMKLVKEFYRAVERDRDYPAHVNEWKDLANNVKHSTSVTPTSPPGLRHDPTDEEMAHIFKRWRHLLLLFTESEISRLAVWSHPLYTQAYTPKEGFDGIERSLTDDGWRIAVNNAWDVSPKLAVQLANRFTYPAIPAELQRRMIASTSDAVNVPEAFIYLLTEKNIRNDFSNLKFLLYWAPVPPITATSFFSPVYGRHPLVLQYAMRVLEHFPVETVFFYVPQLVQALRTDTLGYVEKFILGAAKISQLFAHQIIWNMNANMFKDEDSLVPDSLKPVLDRIVGRIVGSLSGADKEFYEREFNFFNLVTGISGKLKPFIKKSKPEKKRKIDEEIRKIKVDVGVYLPSNPEGSVIDIDYDSGRPLQSHAKAPFLATFKIRKDKRDMDEDVDWDQRSNEPEHTIDVWQSAIFKVGDDCRQDVLALQLIALFKTVFTSVGLDLFLLPYKVVATAPGCGVIDVIPKAISRDQIGREKVNSLYDYFITKYGGLDSIEFQKARNNFVQSLAAYSVILYLLQIKDRHNGNIMLNDDGHIIHIDFGFLLDISPGGVNFESSPFKLTTEMIQLMGGNSNFQPYRWFCELCVKAYLAARPFADEICQMVFLMLDSGLPCFKGEATIKKLRSRFQLEKNERGAADFMIDRINESCKNQRTGVYDYFQWATNGIPY